MIETAIVSVANGELILYLFLVISKQTVFFLSWFRLLTETKVEEEEKMKIDKDERFQKLIQVIPTE